MNKDTSKTKFFLSFAEFHVLCIARELWWTNQEFPHVDIITSLFFLLVYHLEDEQ
jgi:hypothetical protein